MPNIEYARYVEQKMTYKNSIFFTFSLHPNTMILQQHKWVSNYHSNVQLSQ